jgi:hypothetical protein
MQQQLAEDPVFTVKVLFMDEVCVPRVGLPTFTANMCGQVNMFMQFVAYGTPRYSENHGVL